MSGLGAPRVHHRRTDSTSTQARALAAAGAPHGTLVTAAEQTAGRGRQGRDWSAPPGRALLLSLVLRDWPPLLPLAAAAAVAEVSGSEAAIKWPNDVQLAGRKVAGILVEGRSQEGWMVLGIGLNAALRPEDLPPDLRETAGTLGRRPSELEEVLAALLEALERWLAAPADEVLAAFRARDSLAGKEVEWASGGGRATGVDDGGRLLVDTEAGQVALDAGEVHLRRGA